MLPILLENRGGGKMLYKREFWKATAIRLIRTFLTTILGVWTAGQLITDIDWGTTLLSAGSATIYILTLCLVQGLPEVKEDSDE